MTQPTKSKSKSKSVKDRRARTSAERRRIKHENRKHHLRRFSAHEQGALHQIANHHLTERPPLNEGLEAHTRRQVMADYAVATLLGLDMPVKPGVLVLPDGKQVRVRSAQRVHSPYIVAKRVADRADVAFHVLAWVQGETSDNPVVTVVGFATADAVRDHGMPFIGRSADAQLSVAPDRMRNVLVLTERVAAQRGILGLLTKAAQVQQLTPPVRVFDPEPVAAPEAPVRLYFGEYE